MKENISALFGWTLSLGYNPNSMESVPLYRRPLVVATTVFILFGALYYWLLSSAGPEAVPYSFLSDFILAVGILTLLVCIVYTFNIFSSASSNSRSMLRTLLTLAILILWLFVHVPFFLPGSGRTLMRAILVDLDFMLILTLILLAITAQFVLPVSGSHQRMAVIRRLLGFALSERGPVTYIRDGKSIEAHEESKRVGLGVFLIDHSSAAVLRTDIAFTRAIGPGVTFTKAGERRAEALDLRKQVRSLQGQISSPLESETLTTAAITKDGIPVAVDLSIFFMLDPGPATSQREGRESQSQHYEFNRDSVEKAVYGHMYGEVDDLPWTDLPMLLAADIWRERVKEHDLEDLIQYQPDRSPPLETLQLTIMSRLAVKKDLSNGEPSATSREGAMLQSRGIRVLDVRLSNLRLPEDVQRERTLRWRENWAGAVQEKLSNALDEVHREERRGEAIADDFMVRGFTHSLMGALKGGRPPSRRDTLALLVKDAAAICSQDDRVSYNQELLNHLNQMAESIQKLDPNCHEKGSGET
ncbi:MAG: hypothetical protein ACERKY_10060 [Anaerolineales bacterium]